jgi:hypothetical protein
MKHFLRCKYVLTLALAIPALGQVPSGGEVLMSNAVNDLHLGKFRYPETTVAGLSGLSASSLNGYVYVVTNCLSSTDCSTTGTSQVIVRSNGTTWVIIGGVGPPGSTGPAGQDAPGFPSGVTVQGGASYTYLSANNGQIISRSNAGLMGDTLPQCGSTGFPDHWVGQISNSGGSNDTITAVVSSIVDPFGTTASTFIIPPGSSYFLTCRTGDGNWYATGGGGSGASSFSALTGSWTKSQAPATTMYTDQTNTATSAGLLDFSLGKFRPPSASALTCTPTGSWFAVDTAARTLCLWDGTAAATIPLLYPSSPVLIQGLRSATPTTPGANQSALYVNSGDSLIHTKDDSGIDTPYNPNTALMPVVNVPMMPLPPVFSSTAPATVANTTTATSLLGTFTGSNTICGGCFLDIGTTISVHARGSLGVAATAPTLTLTLSIAGTTIATFVPQLIGGETIGWNIQYEFTIASLTSVNGGGAMSLVGASGAYMNYSSQGTTSGLDFTVAQAIDLKATWGTASSSNTITPIVLISRVL